MAIHLSSLSNSPNGAKPKKNLDLPLKVLWKWNITRMRPWQIGCVYIFQLERTQTGQTYQIDSLLLFSQGDAAEEAMARR